MSHITYIKKVLANGQPCSRCANISTQLKSDGLLNQINHLIVADENDSDSIGRQLANRYQVKQIPFFIVDDEHGNTHIFQDYQEFKHYIQN